MSLLGFEKYGTLKLSQLNPMIQRPMADLGINFRGARVSDKINVLNQLADEEYSNEFIDSLMDIVNSVTLLNRQHLKRRTTK